ncbi:MAG: tRNA (adenosine(37)-N6)-threonylcarbamoyltransferase complex dimerization subunit type 1 TsaB [Ferruginibacter sp.]
MALILHISTAGSTAFVSLATDGKVLEQISNDNRNDHAAFLQPAISQLVKNQQLDWQNLDAIAVSNGPGSYTGLRVGLSSAKGLCYALQKPLITVSTLQVMALACYNALKDDSALYIPMIDARRMEVFTATYEAGGKELVPAHALILDANSFVGAAATKKLVFCGDGAEKFSTVFKEPDAVFFNDYDMVQSFAALAFQNFNSTNFASLAYAEPLYVKEFYTGK